MIRAGRIVATHGISGSVIMTHVLGVNNWLKKGHALMVEMQRGSRIPYFVAGVRATGNDEYIVELEDVSSPQAARLLIKKDVYVDEKILSGLATESPLLWIGFTVMDAAYGNLGKLTDVIQAGNQWIGTIIHNENEVLIPLINETIKGIDLNSKSLKTNLPHGLIEVYE